MDFPFSCLIDCSTFTEVIECSVGQLSVEMNTYAKESFAWREEKHPTSKLHI